MSIQWSGAGPELLLRVDRSAAAPLRTQLEAQIRDAIRTGRLGIDERLPSSRELARALGLSRGLVQECYEQLRAEGYLTSRVGSATRVAAGGPAPAPTPPRRDRRGGPEAPLVADFRSGVPDLASFPRTDWLWALREAARAAPNAAFDYGDPRGAETLRAVLASYLRRVRASAADPEHMVVCAGFAQGLALTLRALAATGVTTVAREDPGSITANADAADIAGMRIVAVPVDAGGIDVAALARTDARTVVVTPAHQWPTGVVLAPDRRLELIAWARERDATIIEDDYDAEFRYDREPVGSLQGLAADRVVSIGTVSKSLAPSLRLGWILCPPALAPGVAAQKNAHDRGSPGLDQYALAALIESGRYDRHLRRMRGLYGARRAVLIEALAATDVAVSGLAAGFHAIVHLPPGAYESSVIAAARERRVGLYGMSEYADRDDQLLLGFGNTGERAIREGIAAIADLLRQ